MGGIGNKFKNVLDPMRGAAEATGWGDFYNLGADPLDIYGERADENRNRLENIQMDSANEGIAAAEEMRQIIETYLEPYRTAGMGALPDFAAQVTTGQTQNALSPEYLYGRDQGMKNVNRQLSAQGRRHSTFGGEQMGAFLGALGQEEAQRQYGRNLDAIKMGQGVTDTLGGADQTLGGQAGSMYQNLGNALNMGYQNYGAQRRNSMTNAGKAIGGAGDWAIYNWGIG